MGTSQNNHKEPSTSAAMVRVWDRVVRVFHWSLLIVFTTMYIAAQSNEIEIHSLVGYLLLALVLVRLIWGVIGSEHARFRSFAYSPRTVLLYLKNIVSGHPQRFIGHNPAGAIMVFMLLLVLSGLVLTGLITEATIEFTGPLLGFTQGIDDQLAYDIQKIHQVLADVSLWLIGFHIVGVLLACIQHRENLVRAMVTGYKAADAEQINSTQ